MKFALCISGYFSNKDRDDLTKTRYIYDNIINNVSDIDIFIHSYDVKNEKNIRKKYANTKICCVEPQFNFMDSLSYENIKYIQELHRNNFKSKEYNIFSSLSFMNSRKKAIYYAINFAKSNSFKYDAIIWCRFDLGHRIKRNHLNTNPGKFIFKDKYDYNNIYAAFWYQLNAGYADHWFFSSPKNMKILADMYDFSLIKCYTLNNDYIDLLKKFPDTNKNDNCSNEILKTSKSKLLINIPFVDSANNHILHKYYFMKTGLYKKSKFLDFTNT